MIKQAHWCDKECSVIIIEYKCATCDHEAFDFVYFDDARCKVLKRVPVEMSAIDAPKFVKCGEQICDSTKQETNTAPKKTDREVGGRRITDHANPKSRTKAGQEKPAASKKAQA